MTKWMLAGTVAGIVVLVGPWVLISMLAHLSDDTSTMVSGPLGLLAGGGGALFGLWWHYHREDGAQDRKNKAYERERAKRLKALASRKVYADELKNIDPLKEES